MKWLRREDPFVLLKDVHKFHLAETLVAINVKILHDG
jgi:hypothetical protein